MYKKILLTAFAATLSLSTFAQDKVYLIKNNEVVAKYNAEDVDYISFELPAGVVDNTGDVVKKTYLSAVGKYYGTHDEVADYQIQFSTRPIMDENTPVDFLYLQFMGPAADFHNLSVPEGTYTVQAGDARKPLTFYKGVRETTSEGEQVGGTIVIERPNKDDVIGTLVTGGTFTVTKNESSYTFAGNLKLENGQVLEFGYEGACVVENESDEKDDADFLPLPDSKLTGDVEVEVGEAYYGGYGEMFSDKPGYEYKYIYLYSPDYSKILEAGFLVKKSDNASIILPKGKYTVAKVGSELYNSGNNVAIGPFQVMGETGIGTYGCWITVDYADQSPLVSGEIEVLEDYTGDNLLKVNLNLKDNAATPHTVTCSYNGSADKL